MADEKKKFRTIKLFQYLVSKKGKKHLKLNDYEKADEETKKVVAAVRAALGGREILMMDLYDDEFRAKHEIPDFNRGNVTLLLEEGETVDSAPAKANEPKKTGVDF